MSPGEAAEIVAAYGLLSWDSPADYTLDAVGASLQSIEQTLRREPGSTTVLSWDREDDWDVPLTTDEGETSRSWVPQGAWCLALRNHGFDG